MENFDLVGEAVDLVDFIGKDTCVESAGLVNHHLPLLKRHFSLNRLIIFYFCLLDLATKTVEYFQNLLEITVVAQKGSGFFIGFSTTGVLFVLYFTGFHGKAINSFNKAICKFVRSLAIISINRLLKQKSQGILLFLIRFWINFYSYSLLICVEESEKDVSVVIMIVTEN